MRVRSWMAALALIGASTLLIGRGLSAQGTGEATPSKPKAKAGAKGAEKPALERRLKSGATTAKTDGTKLPKVHLRLAIAGLGTEGCDVEIKPANRSVKFRPAPIVHVKSDGHATIELREIELRGADKTCSLAITVRQPGQEPQTIYRGFMTNTTTAGTPDFNCFINSRLADASSGRTIRR